MLNLLKHSALKKLETSDKDKQNSCFYTLPQVNLQQDKLYIKKKTPNTEEQISTLVIQYITKIYVIFETPHQKIKQSTEINPEMTHTNNDFKVVIMNTFKDFQENMVTMQEHVEISVEE